MWRVHLGDRVGDMTNLSRAKDAGITWTRPRGLGSSEVARWHRRETAPVSSSIRYSDEAATPLALAPSALLQTHGITKAAITGDQITNNGKGPLKRPDPSVAANEALGAASKYS
jgi:hypothetical protein